MFILSIQTIHKDVVKISCDSADVHNVLNLLESHPKVRTYQICNEIGIYNDSNLNYSFRGYAFPSGKAVEKFTWDF